VRATSAPNTFIFTELLQTPQIQALASSDEFAPYLTVLQIFSHGTYSSYTSTAGLPELNDAQRLKLRQLSLLSLAKKDSNTSTAGSPALDYASLQKALDLPSRQALEELVISAIYAGLLKAQLNPKASLVQINSVSPLRDVAPTAISGLLSSLQAWAGRCEATLESLSCQMTQLRADADRRAARAAARTLDIEVLIENEKKGGQAPNNTHPSSLPPASSSAAANNSAAPRKSTRNILNPHTHHTHNPASTPTPDDGGGTYKTTANNEVNNMLTVSGGSSVLPVVDGATGDNTRFPATASSASQPELQVKSAVKRGSGQMDSDGDAGDANGVLEREGMDVDGEDDNPDDGGNKRASRRKLEP
jgi:COP9 signalosome complex subunit 7